MFDVVCIGNALIDSFLDISDENKFIRADSKTGELCIKLGEKIPIESAQFELGGNACNVSVGLSRLGFKASLIAEIGDDAFSNRIKKSLLEEKVDLSHFIVSHAPASFAAGINFKSDRTLFVHHVERSHDFKYDGINTKWIYLSSIGEKWRHVYREVSSLTKNNNIKLAFNPGTRQIAAGQEVLDSVLAATQILFLNKEEAQRIVYGPTSLKLRGASKGHSAKDNKAEIQELAKRLQMMGARIVVITDSSRGSFALDMDGSFYHQEIVEAKIVEKTGAGDSFASGFLAAIFNSHDTETALKWGALNSASVIGKVGAQPGLLTKEQMIRKL